MGKKMENNIRFRNHISIVAERLGRVLLLVIVAAISGLAVHRLVEDLYFHL